MNDEQFIDRALELWEAAEDNAVPSVESLCAERPDLIEEVRGRIADLQFLEAYLNPRRAAPSSAIAPGDRIGEFRVVGELGRGGMGIVYACLQEKPHRRVAVKIIHPDRVTPDALRRLELEAQVLGMLKHDRIARVLQAGIADVGAGSQPFLAMELVEGEPIDHYARRHALPVAERLRMLVAVCEAVEHAHHRGVIHRDLKPANILVNGEGDPVVLDFGIARLLPELQSGASHDWHTLGTLGSLAYMSPEQVGESSAELDTRSDVYALGLIGYELVADQLPYEILDRPLKDVVRSITDLPPLPLGQLRPELAGDLEAIFNKALAKEKDHRYHSAAAFAGDLRRFLAGFPTLARPVGHLETFRRWACRNPLLSTVAALALLSCILGSLVSARYAMLASQRAAELDQLVNRLEDKTRLAEERSSMYRRASYNSELSRVGQLASANPTAARAQLEKADRLAPDLRGFAWHLLRRMTGRHAGEFAAGEPIANLALSEDDRRLAVLAADGKITVWDVARRVELSQLPPQQRAGTALALTSEGNWLATATGGGVRVENPTSGSFELLDVAGAVHTLAFAGDRLAVGAGKQMHIFEKQESWRPRHQLPLPSAAVEAKFLDGGERLVCLCRRAVVVAWQTETGEQASRQSLARATITAGAFANERPWVAMADASRRVSIWDWKQGVQMHPGRRMPRSVRGLTFSPDDSRLAVSAGGAVRLFDSRAGRQISRFPTRNASAGKLTYHRTSNSILAAGTGVQVWRCDNSHWRRRLVWSHAKMLDVAFMPDASVVVGCGEDGCIRAWDPHSGAKAWRSNDRGAPAGVIACSQRNQLAHVEDATSIVVRRLPVSGAQPWPPPLRLEGHAERIRSLDFSPDGRWLASGSRDGTARIWSFEPARQNQVLSGHRSGVTSVAFSPAEDLLATGSEDNRVRLWRCSSGELIAELKEHRAGVLCLAFSPDGRQLVSGGRDSLAVVWDVAGRRPAHRLEIGEGRIRAVAYSPRGDTIATGSGSVVFWDPVSGQQQLTVAHTAPVHALAFSPDGDRLALASTNGEIMMYDAPATVGVSESPTESAKAR